MQIDFHHGVTYVVARLGGLGHEAAATVAHAAQYVDDATHDGPLLFRTGERYVRVTSAHKTLDLQANADAGDNRLVWVPFHFLPGNHLPARHPSVLSTPSPEDEFHQRLMCRPGSAVAWAMMGDVIQRQDLPFGLHRLGIALHTFVDTWAHQQFVGAVCDLNRLEEVQVEAVPPYGHDQALLDELDGWMAQAQQAIASQLPVGHASALCLPDLPFIRWRFTRMNGQKVVRDNPSDFLQAAQAACQVVQRYVLHDPDAPVPGLPAHDQALIDHLLRHTISLDEHIRHEHWLQAIGEGRFSFGPADVQYIEQGEGSWKMDALGLDPDDEDGVRYTYRPEFLQSHWKRFHDAVQMHRLFVLHELLPRHGLCAS